MAVVTEIKPITNKDIHKKALVNPDYDPEKSKVICQKLGILDFIMMLNYRTTA